MSNFDSDSLDTLSDSDAVSLLFELTGHGQDAGDQLLRIDAMVYHRLAQAYDGDAPPVLQQGAR